MDRVCQNAAISIAKCPEIRSCPGGGVRKRNRSILGHHIGKVSGWYCSHRYCFGGSAAAIGIGGRQRYGINACTVVYHRWVGSSGSCGASARERPAVTYSAGGVIRHIHCQRRTTVGRVGVKGSYWRARRDNFYTLGFSSIAAIVGGFKHHIIGTRIGIGVRWIDKRTGAAITKSP